MFESVRPRGVRRAGLALGAVAALAIVATACGSSNTSGSGSNSADPGSHGKYTIVLSNSFTGDPWRIEMVNEFKAACGMPPLSQHATCSVYNAASNTVSDQASQLSAIISTHPSAIVIDAASPTGLNGVIGQACDQHILVVAFDDTSPSMSSCAVQVNISDAEMGSLMAQWLVQKLHGKGNILMVTGLPGTSIDTDRNVAAEAVFSKSRGIHIVDSYPDQWNPAVGLSKTAAVLPSLHSIQGAWVSGGTTGVLQAFTNANRPLPLSTGEAENGYRQEIGQHKADGYSVGDPPYLSAIALGYAYQILSGSHDRSNLLDVPLSIVSQSNSQQNLTWFTGVPAGFYADVIDTGSNPIVKGLCLQAAKSGTPCPGSLTFHFPS